MKDFLGSYFFLRNFSEEILGIVPESLTRGFFFKKCIECFLKEHFEKFLDESLKQFLKVIQEEVLHKSPQGFMENFCEILERIPHGIHLSGKTF